MKKLNLVLIISILLLSCNSKIAVDEFCKVKSAIDGEYATYKQGLALAKDNDTTNMELDTMYFKIDKQTQYKFKLKDRLEYEASRQLKDFDVVKYVYLSPSNEHEAAWNGTMIEYMITKYSDWINCICDKDMKPELLNAIANKLNENGYPIKLPKDSKFEGELKEVLIKYQKDNKLPYGSINIKTLDLLGVGVRESF